MEVGWTLRWGFFELFRNPSVEPIFVEEDITMPGHFDCTVLGAVRAGEVLWEVHRTRKAAAPEKTGRVLLV